MIRSRLKHALDWRFRGVIDRLDALTSRVEQIHGRVEEFHGRLESADRRLAELNASVGALDVIGQLADDASATRTAVEQRLQPAVRAILDEEAANRRRLFSLRESAAYAAPYGERDPLVSVAVTTVGPGETLLQRALPSLLAQTYDNLEVIVVGDATAAELEHAIASLGDRRVRFSRLSQRLTINTDSRRHWLVGSAMARNEAARQACGRWILHFDHDDHLRPDSIASLLDLARESRAEVAYGGFEEHTPDGGGSQRLGFPPRWGSFAWPAALVHAGLRFFERELVAGELDLPGDMYLLVRMLRAGVRFTMHDEIVLDYFPSAAWGRPTTAASPSVTVPLTRRGPVFGDQVA